MMSAVREMKIAEDWEIQIHVGNPNMARVIGPKFKSIPECEGGGWYTEPETARLIAAAPKLLAALRECLLEHGGFVIKGECERRARAALAKAREA